MPLTINNLNNYLNWNKNDYNFKFSYSNLCDIEIFHVKINLTQSATLHNKLFSIVYYYLFVILKYYNLIKYFYLFINSFF